MKIAYVINSLGNAGGMERVLSTKVNYLTDILGYEISVLVKTTLPSDLFFEFSKKIKIHSFGISKIYLYDNILIFLDDGIFVSIIYTILATVFSIFISWISWNIIESPVLRLKTYFKY